MWKPINVIYLINILKDKRGGTPGWLSQLSIRLRLRSWSHSLWVRAPCQAVCWQLGAWSLLRILCLPLSLPLPHSCSLFLSLSLSQNIKIKNNFFKIKRKWCDLYTSDFENLHEMDEPIEKYNLPTLTQAETNNPNSTGMVIVVPANLQRLDVCSLAPPTISRACPVLQRDP